MNKLCSQRDPQTHILAEMQPRHVAPDTTAGSPVPPAGTLEAIVLSPTPTIAQLLHPDTGSRHSLLFPYRMVLRIPVLH